MEHLFAKKKNVGAVSSFSDLLVVEFQGDINAICWHRSLHGDFSEIVSRLQLRENITEVSIDDLLSLPLSAEGDAARELIINDLKVLTDFGASPSLNLIKQYERDEELEFISTDVYSYHVDRSPVSTDTFLCTYYGAASDLLSNDEVLPKVEILEIREKLRELYDGPEEGFNSFLSDNYFDLHYQAKSNAKPLNFGVGNLWKLAVDHPEQKVLPCVHRAPLENQNQCRLLLIC